MRDGARIFGECLDLIIEQLNISRTEFSNKIAITRLNNNDKGTDASTGIRWLSESTFPQTSKFKVIKEYFGNMFQILDDSEFISIKQMLYKKVNELGIFLERINEKEKDTYIKGFLSNLYREAKKINKIGIEEYKKIIYEQKHHDLTLESDSVSNNGKMEIGEWIHIVKKLFNGKDIYSHCKINDIKILKSISELIGEDVCTSFSDIVAKILGEKVNVSIKIIEKSSLLTGKLEDWKAFTLCRCQNSKHRPKNIFRIVEFLEYNYILTEKTPLFIGNDLENTDIIMDEQKYKYYNIYPLEEWTKHYKTKFVYVIGKTALIDKGAYCDNTIMADNEILGFLSLDTTYCFQDNQEDLIRKIILYLEMFSVLLNDYFKNLFVEALN